MRLAANQHLRLKSSGCKDSMRRTASPATLPQREQSHLWPFGCDDKLNITMAVRFLPVRCQKIRPARKHVADHVLDDDGNTVGFFVEGRKNSSSADLPERAFGQFPVATESQDGIFQIMFGKRSFHKSVFAAFSDSRTVAATRSLESVCCSPVLRFLSATSRRARSSSPTTATK